MVFVTYVTPPPQKERTNSRIHRNTCLLGEQARQLKRKINYLTGNPCIYMHMNTHTQKHTHLRKLITYEKIFNSLIINKMQKKIEIKYHFTLIGLRKM